SLVQAEAGNPDEAPKIARVIYNRLAAGQPLGIDATSRYLSIISGRPVDFASPSPYNTRRRPGLPPTPIAAPGDFALDAAAHPATGNWLYYVRSVQNDAQGRPQHIFTASAQEFERAKKACHDAGLGCGAP
ncbi:MAG: endolytic transglycosylase MltG, partial [Actinobacteria bacterium]|nr:endolytic transglycosylase MltG [Actinomycetota bacterium]